MGENVSINNSDLAAIKSGIKRAFGKIKDEFEEHLDSINDNTNEINVIQEQVIDLSEKVDNLSIKIDEILIAIGNKNPMEEQISKKIILTLREQEIFMSLYISDESLSYKEISRKLGLTDYLVQNNIINMIGKGIPIIKQIKDNTVYLSIDAEFKALQTKKNLLKIDDSISRQLIKEQYN